MSEPVVEWTYDEHAGLLRMTYDDPDLPDPIVLGFTPAALLELGSRIVNGDQPQQLA